MKQLGSYYVSVAITGQNAKIYMYKIDGRPQNLQFFPDVHYFDRPTDPETGIAVQRGSKLFNTNIFLQETLNFAMILYHSRLAFTFFEIYAKISHKYRPVFTSKTQKK